MKLRGKFFLSHALAVGVSAVALMGVLWSAARYSLLRQIEARQQSQAEALQRSARQALQVRELLPVLTLMRQLGQEEGVAWAAWKRPGSAWLAVPAERAAELSASPSQAGRHERPSVNGRRLVERIAELPDGGRLSVAHWSDLAESEAERGLQAWRWPALLALGVALLLGLLLGAGLAEGLVRPLRAIAEGTRRVRKGELDAGLDIERSDEIGALARDFNAMTVELSELDRLKREFVAGVSHDLGTPLQSIQSAARLLEQSAGPRLKPREHGYLLTIGNGAETLLAFVQSLLNVAKIEAGRVDPYLESLDLAAELRALAAIYEPQAQEKGVALRLQAPDSLPARADLLQFRQMAGNLLSNAVKFTDQGAIDVELKAAGPWAALRVKDSGIGIDPRHHALIFDRFYRVRQDEGAPARQGSGLGLAIVKGLAEAHGGSVSVDSALGQGAAFTLLLPLKGGSHA